MPGGRSRRQLLAALVACSMLLMAVAVAVAAYAPAALAQAPAGDQDTAPVTIRYARPDADAVWLIWGLNGWQVPDASRRPAGTVVRDGVPATPMARDGDGFTATLTVPSGATIDYAFQVFVLENGDRREIWDTNGAPGRDYHTVAQAGEVVTIRPGDPSVRPVRRRDVLRVWLRVAGWLATAAAGAGVLAAWSRLHRPGAALLTLGAITLVGLLLRLQSAHEAFVSLPDAPARLVGDEPGYDYLARALLDGVFFNWPGRTPVYPVFLAAVYAVFGGSYGPVLYVQAVAAATAIPLTFLLARTSVAVPGALVAAWLVAVHPGLIGHVTKLYTEPVYVPLLLVTVIVLTWAARRPTVGRFACFGLVLGILTLCRPLTLMLPVILPFVIWRLPMRRRLLLTAVAGLALVATISPWTYHNYRTYGVFLPLATSTGVLWQGSPEYYHLMQERLTHVEVWAQYLNPDVNGGYNAFSIEGDRYFTARGLASIRAEPGVFVWYTLLRVPFFWFGHPPADWPGYVPFDAAAWLPYFASSYVAQVFAARLFPFVVLAALAILWRRLGPFVPLLAVCGYVWAFHAATYAEIRYSEPLYPLLAVVVGAAAAHVVAVLRGRVAVVLRRERWAKRGA